MPCIFKIIEKLSPIGDQAPPNIESGVRESFRVVLKMHGMVEERSVSG